MAAKEIEDELLGSMEKLPAEVRALWRDAPAAASFYQVILADVHTRRALQTLRRLDLAPEVRSLAERRVRLERRLRTLAAADRIFSHWITLHRPIAVFMYVISTVHVILSYMFTPALRG